MFLNYQELKLGEFDVKKIISFILMISLALAFSVNSFAAGYTIDFFYNSIFDWDVIVSQKDWVAGGGTSFGGGAGRRFYTGGNGDFRYGNSGATSSGATNSYSFNSGTTTSYQVIKNENNYTSNYWYNPVTNNYTTINNIKYSPTYNTYNITNNEYNAYITNNYTYYSYYIVDSDSQSYYYEIYYQLPDGRNSYDLSAEDVWGEYFIYDVTNYDYVVEDDGKTLALFHFDGDLKDSSANNCQAAYEGNTASYTFVDSDFGSALKMSDNDLKLNITLPESLDGDFTIEGRAKFSAVSPGELIPPVDHCPDGNYLYTLSFDSGDEMNAWVKANLGEGSWHFREGNSPTDYWMSYDYTSYARAACYHYDLNNISSFLKTDNWKFWLPNEISYDTIAYDYLTNYQKDWNGAQELPNGTFKLTFNKGYRKEVETSITDEIPNGCEYTLPSDYFSFAFVRSGDTLTYYQNGKVQGTWTNSDDFGNVISLYIDSSQVAYWDELRVTNEALYTDDYVPSSQPWDTNKVFVLPETGTENQIAIKSNQEPGTLRVGGARPTFPSDGDVYVSLVNDRVVDVQQYQTNAWVSVGASIWYGGKWNSFIGWDCSQYEIEEPGEVTPSPSPDPGGDGDGSGSGGSGGSGIFDGVLSELFGSLVGFIGGIFSGLLNLLVSLVGWVVWLVKLSTVLLPFLPPGAFAILAGGAVVIVILAIIKFITGLF